MARLTFSFVLALLSLPLSLSQSTPDTRWLVPDGSKADLSTTYINGNSVTLSWQTLNSSICDLWLTSWDAAASSYATRLASNINLDHADTLPWTVDVGSEQVQINDQFVLRFIPTGTEYAGLLQFVEISSPGFIIRANAAASTSTNPTVSTTATIVASSATSFSSSSSPTTMTTVSSAAATSSLGLTSPSPPDNGLGTGVKVGAAVAALAAVCIIIALALWVIRLRRRVKAAGNHRSQGIVPEGNSITGLVADLEMTTQEKRISGLHEVQGDKTQPQELSSQKERRSIYEMAG